MSQSFQASPDISAARHGFLTDIWYGAVLGDFDRTKRIPGALTQIIFGYLPVVGSICAARDALACLQQRDGVGVLLNALSFIPVVGGVAKTLDVVHGTMRLREAAVRQRAQAARPKRSLLASLGVALLLSLFAIVYGVGAGLGTWFLLDGGHHLLAADLAKALGLVAPFVLVPFGLLIMLISSIMGRSWLGGILTPFLMLVGFLTALQLGLPIR
ncbi:MAG TPA: hypothetical protein VF807_08030 [Ktedonobacterales bacterium]